MTYSPTTMKPLRLPLLAASLLLATCAAVHADPRDPLESSNRAVDGFNRSVDHSVIRPVARAYRESVPQPVQTGVGNFFGNLGDAWSAVNSLLQFNPDPAARDGMRFAMNTVFGGLGLMDLASKAGIERQKEDFGVTLARWGVPPGPYLVLPLLGPSTLRDAAALPADWIGNPLSHVAPMADRAALVAGQAVETRVKLLPVDPVLDSALDPYTFMRDAYLQHRNTEVDGGLASAQTPTEGE
jgi:phospholipid-binding lipoprotein MlaA